MSKTKAKQRVVRYFYDPLINRCVWRIDADNTVTVGSDTGWKKSMVVFGELKDQIEKRHGSLITPTKARALFPKLFKKAKS